MSNLTEQDRNLLAQLSERLSQTAHVETNPRASKIILIRDIRIALREAGIEVSIAEARHIVETLLTGHVVYQKRV